MESKCWLICVNFLQRTCGLVEPEVDDGRAVMGCSGARISSLQINMISILSTTIDCPAGTSFEPSPPNVSLESLSCPISIIPLIKELYPCPFHFIVLSVSTAGNIPNVIASYIPRSAMAPFRN